MSQNQEPNGYRPIHRSSNTTQDESKENNFDRLTGLSESQESSSSTLNIGSGGFTVSNTGTMSNTSLGHITNGTSMSNNTRHENNNNNNNNSIRNSNNNNNNTLSSILNPIDPNGTPSNETITEPNISTLDCIRHAAHNRDALYSIGMIFINELFENQNGWKMYEQIFFNDKMCECETRFKKIQSGERLFAKFLEALQKYKRENPDDDDDDTDGSGSSKLNGMNILDTSSPDAPKA